MKIKNPYSVKVGKPNWEGPWCKSSSEAIDAFLNKFASKLIRGMVLRNASVVVRRDYATDEQDDRGFNYEIMDNTNLEMYLSFEGIRIIKER